MQHAIKPFPPFGTLLYQLRILEIKISFSPYLFCGDFAREEAFKMNAHGQIALYLPQTKFIQDYFWPIEDLSVVLFNTGGCHFHKLELYALSLIDEGARQVCVYPGDLSPVELYKR